VRYGIVGLKKGRHGLQVVPDPHKGTGTIKWSGPRLLPQPLEKAELLKAD
jgi:hypothetical protein